MDFDKFLNFLNEYNNHYRELLAFESNKLNLIIKDDVEGLRELLNAEQAIIMKTNQLEKKRISLMDDDYKELTLKQLIEKVPTQYKPQYQQAYYEMSRLVLQTKKVNNNAQEVVARRMKILEEERVQTSSIYNKSGSKSTLSDNVTIDKGV